MKYKYVLYLVLHNSYILLLDCSECFIYINIPFLTANLKGRWVTGVGTSLRLSKWVSCAIQIRGLWKKRTQEEICWIRSHPSHPEFCFTQQPNQLPWRAKQTGAKALPWCCLLACCLWNQPRNQPFLIPPVTVCSVTNVIIFLPASASVNIGQLEHQLILSVDPWRIRQILIELHGMTSERQFWTVSNKVPYFLLKCE